MNIYNLCDMFQKSAFNQYDLKEEYNSSIGVEEPDDSARIKVSFEIFGDALAQIREAVDNTEFFIRDINSSHRYIGSILRNLKFLEIEVNKAEKLVDKEDQTLLIDWASDYRQHFIKGFKTMHYLLRQELEELMLLKEEESEEYTTLSEVSRSIDKLLGKLIYCYKIMMKCTWI